MQFCKTVLYSSHILFWSYLTKLFCEAILSSHLLLLSSARYLPPIFLYCRPRSGHTFLYCLPRGGPNLSHPSSALFRETVSLTDSDIQVQQQQQALAAQQKRSVSQPRPPGEAGMRESRSTGNIAAAQNNHYRYAEVHTHFTEDRVDG